jgi:hypothetical protein
MAQTAIYEAVRKSYESGKRHLNSNVWMLSYLVLSKQLIDVQKFRLSLNENFYKMYMSHYLRSIQLNLIMKFTVTMYKDNSYLITQIHIHIHKKFLKKYVSNIQLN